MLTRPAVVVGLLAVAVSQVCGVALAEADPNYARHMHAVKNDRMLKRRSTNDASNATNPCKRDDAPSGGSISIVDAAHNGATGSSGRQPLTGGTWSVVPAASSNSAPASSSSASASVRGSFGVSSAAAHAAPSNNTGSGMKVAHSWTGNDFQNWDYFNYPDPTHGNVNYVPLATAQSENLIGLSNGKFKMSVSTGALSQGNRDSVRITSPQTWKKGQLVVASFSHVPEGCSTWPAFWSIGAKRDWPAGGEIDILEGVNSVAGNTYTLHTTNGCTRSGQQSASTMALTADCQYQPGCSYKDTDPTSFGPALNAAGGGVYAAYFDDSGIKIWFWSASKVPSSVQNGSPDMSTFGEPRAYYSSSTCDINSFFDDEQILIINTTLMGDWAGATFWQNGCTGTLADTLANPSNYDKAYWLVDYVKIYQN